MARDTHRDALIAVLYRERGLTLGAIGNRFGVSRERIRQILESQGVPRRPHGGAFASKGEVWRRNRAFAESVAPRYGTGPGTWSRDLARLGGMSTETLQSHLRALGVRLGGVPTKLSVQQVRRLKAALVNRRCTMAELARRFGISNTTLYRIISGEHWATVPWPDGQASAPRRRRSRRRAPSA